MRYVGTVFRPPSEAQSLLIQATIGCPHNKCSFCGMYRKKRFQIRPLAEIKEDLRMALDYYGPEVESVFFPDGNTILMKTPELAEILTYAYELFPKLSRATVYGSAKFLKLKSPQEFKLLKDAGLTRIHSGLESGDDRVLTGINKGFCAQEMIDSGLKVKDAGIELSAYILIGIGGREGSEQHALRSAEVLNAFTPHFIRLRTYGPVKNTPLFEDWQLGKFHLLSPHEAVRETRLLVSNLQGPGELCSDHVSNYAWINGKLPGGKPQMLAALDQLLQVPEEDFQIKDSRYF